MRAPAGKIRHLEIVQRSRATSVQDEGTTGASVFYRVGVVSGSVEIEAEGESSKLTLETNGETVAVNHLLKYDGRLWRVNQSVKREDEATVTALEIADGRCDKTKC